jgi:DNA-binding MarR family transcriptional regulator
MPRLDAPLRPSTDEAKAPARRDPRIDPAVDSEITWLLQRAAQQMHVLTGEQAEVHGLQLREYIVLSALHKKPGLTQSELSRALRVDKTTLMSQLDRLEGRGLVVRRSDPRDRRVRYPEITQFGEAVRARVAQDAAKVEMKMMSSLTAEQVGIFRHVLFTIIEDTDVRG